MHAVRSLLASLVSLAFLFAPTPAGAQYPAMSYQGLWWRSPAGSESGWGVNIVHQGDILFATWFTYDTDGTGLWLVMSEGRRDISIEMDPYYGGYGMGGYGMMDPNTKSYTGNLYRTTGPAFDSAHFDPAMVTVTPVGTANFAFTSADRGTFTYTVNGAMQSKPIVRQVYALPMPNCMVGGSRGASPNYQDLWWGAPAGSESGWGINVVHQADTLFVTWFTYDASGRGMWLVMSDGRKTGAATYSGALYHTTGPAFSAATWDGSKVALDQVGTATLSFADPDNGTFTYTVNGVTQVKAIVRQVFSTPVTNCTSP
ncbi:MAG TPA: hypothetical protein VFV55_08770 [Usitatibacteraceae bacterium]|nr:hypothetical protein [Usitatibacteraceae bacterium]